MSCPHCPHCQAQKWAPPEGALSQVEVRERFRMAHDTVWKAADAGVLVLIDAQGDPDPRRRWYLVPDETALRTWYSLRPSQKDTAVRGNDEHRQLAGLCWLLLFGAELNGAAIVRMANDLGASKTALERAISWARGIDVSITQSCRTMGSGVVHDPLSLAPGMRIAIARSENGRTAPLLFETERRDGDAWLMVEGDRVPDRAHCWPAGWVSFAR
jgi:hypothetical protein